jgi:hypothetical protein
LRRKHTVCYICLDPLENYTPDEIEYDHIYNYADGHPQELSNFAPVHASSEPNKANCHKSKGKKSPVEYREELRILKALKAIGQGPGDRLRRRGVGRDRQFGGCLTLLPAHHASSKIPSISTATSSGKEGAPTATRAWRPASPNTSAIRSEAPLTTLG